MKYGFIGCGNMGGALARALAKSTLDFALTDRSGRGKALADELGCQYTDAASIAFTCDRIFLGVKPHMMKDVLAPLVPFLQSRKPTLITMAAGLEMAQIEAFAGGEIPVIRIMPNTPCSIGKGVTLKANDNIDGGFRIAVNEGGAYYDYSKDAVVEMLSNYLSPKVKELLKEAE